LNKFIISIDGPAGSGKQRIAKYISKKYRLYHLDSGILYRRLASIIIKKKINYKDNKNLQIFLSSINFLSARSHLKLRNEKISKLASKIAIIHKVRKFINANQKAIVKKKFKSHKGCVVDGRDIGSKVFKNANIKLFIRVNLEIRAKRRHKQLIELGEKSIYAQILKEINLRDKTDKNRLQSPLVVPRGAVIIDNAKNFLNTKTLIDQAFKKIK
jgi:cytidylate kinase